VKNFAAFLFIVATAGGLIAQPARAVRPRPYFETRLPSVGTRVPFSDDGEAARVQRRGYDFSATKPAPKSLV